jgi:hypothetical protein
LAMMTTATRSGALAICAVSAQVSWVTQRVGLVTLRAAKVWLICARPPRRAARNVAARNRRSDRMAAHAKRHFLYWSCSWFTRAEPPLRAAICEESGGPEHPHPLDGADNAFRPVHLEPGVRNQATKIQIGHQPGGPGVIQDPRAVQPVLNDLRQQAHPRL